MSNKKLSSQCVEKLYWFVDIDDEHEKAFITNVDYYVKLVRRTSKHEKYHSAKAQKRIDRVKKAFAGLTDQDKNFLDRKIDGHISYLDFENNEKIPSCKNMMQALQYPVPPDNKSLSRQALVMFACRAVYFDWVDTKKGNSSLAEVLKIIMNESGVRHDAVDIAGEAVSMMADRKKI